MNRLMSSRIVYLTAGGAGMYCGSCMHDNTLAAALIKLGCDLQLVPTYTPIRTDEENVSLDTVFFGGINVYLQQKIPLFRYLPSFLDRWLDLPWLITQVAGRGIRTSAHELGDLTLSMLRGESGYQRKEVRRLVSWLEREARPNLINLSNILIAGCVPSIKKQLSVPILVTLQGDDLFLEDLAEPYKQEALSLIRQLASQVDGFIVFSRYYAEFMARYLQLSRERFHIVPMGVKLDDFPAETDGRGLRPPTIGYLARLCPAKGLHILVDAFVLLRQMPGMDRARLHVAGWLGIGDRAYYEAQLEKLHHHGLSQDFEYAGVVDRTKKIKFLQSLDLFSVPTTYQEPKGIFVLEALASGVPVVLPEHGAFPELLQGTGGGRLVRPHDPEDLARVLHHLLTDLPTCHALGRQGRVSVLESFGAEQMAARTLAVYRQYLE